MSNRREILTIGLLGAGCTLLRNTYALAGTYTGSSLSPSTVAPGSTGQVLVTPNSDAMFPSLLEVHFPGLSKNTLFQGLNRSAVFISNKDSRPLYAFRLAWQASGPGRAAQSFQRTFAMRPSQELQSRQLTAQFPLVAPGEIALVTPLFSWSRAVFSAKEIPGNLQSITFTTYQQRLPAAALFASAAQRGDSITTSLDAVAFADSVVGPQAAVLANRLINMRNGEHDQSLAISRALKGRAATDIEQAITASLVGVAATAKTSAVYAASRQQFATKVQGVLLSDFERGTGVLAQVKAIRRSSVG